MPADTTTGIRMCSPRTRSTCTCWSHKESIVRVLAAIPRRLIPPAAPYQLARPRCTRCGFHCHNVIIFSVRAPVIQSRRQRGNEMRRVVCLLFCAVAFAGTQANAQDSVDIREWQVPYEQSRPRDPYAESEDSVWFVGQRTGYLARLDVRSGEFEQVELKDGSGPHNLIVDSERHRLVCRQSQPAYRALRSGHRRDRGNHDAGSGRKGSAHADFRRERGKHLVHRTGWQHDGPTQHRFPEGGSHTVANGKSPVPTASRWHRTGRFGLSSSAPTSWPTSIPNTLAHDEIELPREAARPRQAGGHRRRPGLVCRLRRRHAGSLRSWHRNVHGVADAAGQGGAAIRHGVGFGRQIVDGCFRRSTQRIRWLRPRHGAVFRHHEGTVRAAVRSATCTTTNHPVPCGSGPTRITWAVPSSSRTSSPIVRLTGFALASAIAVTSISGALWPFPTAHRGAPPIPQRPITAPTVILIVIRYSTRRP